VTTTPEDNATTWRDLADQLTPEQRKPYEDLERVTQGAGRDGDGRPFDWLVAGAPR
jgi:hypothetical protein